MRTAHILVTILILSFAGGVFAQSSQTQRSRQTAVKQATAYNPLRAVHDVEVGKFYLKRGDIAGAIARFKDALQYRDNYAEPLMLLGEAYEKNNDPATALRYYERYLRILPESPDSKKVRERIAKLQEESKKENSAAARN